MMKNVYSLALVSLGLCFGAVVNSSPVSASEVVDNQSEEILISQLRGHDTYDGEPQIEWGNYSLGRVVGKSGGWMSILAEDGTVFSAEGFVRPGSNVLVGKDDAGEYYLVSAAHSEWIGTLESEYGYKRDAVAQAALNERTAAIWAEIEASSNRSGTTLPERTVTESSTDDEFTPMNDEPVRGLW